VSTPAAAITEITVAQWDEAGWLPSVLAVELPVKNFSVRDLLGLSVGSLVQTEWKSGVDAPLSVNGCQMAWVEFEQIGEQLGVRLTELL
jgi:flagellar motor switch/type III secretory pathway protein FliN